MVGISAKKYGLFSVPKNDSMIQYSVSRRFSCSSPGAAYCWHCVATCLDNWLAPEGHLRGIQQLDI